MAVDGSFVRTMGGSDESFDLTCSPCARKNRNREATKYCVECQDYYCAACVELHDAFPALSAHKILAKSEFPTTRSQTVMSLPTERCGAHSTKLVDMYCKNDDQIGCPVCMAVKHRSCVDLVYIPEEIENIMKDEDLQKIKENMKKARIRMEEMVQARHNNLAEVEQDIVIAVGNIKALRDKINETLDELEKTTIKEYEEKSKRITNKLEAELGEMGDIINNMEINQQQLDSEERNRSQQFVCMKKAQQKLSEADKLITDEAKSSGKTKVEFKESHAIEQFLNGLSSLGKIEEKADDILEEVKKHDCLYKVTRKQQFDVKVSGDSQTCSIHGTCILKSGRLLLADFANRKLKQLDSSTYTVIDQCDLPASPHAVCEISPEEAAVTLNTRTIQIVSMGSRMAPTRSIKTNHDCWGLVFSNGEMFVSDDDKSLFIYDTSGTLLTTIRNDLSGNAMFSKSDVRHVALSEDSCKIYVADDTGVVTLDKKGKVLSRFNDQDISRPVGVCGDDCGNTFVCGNSSHNVIQIGLRGNKLGVLTNKSDGHYGPVSACYDRSNSRLIVTNGGSNSIMVFDLI